MPQTAQRHSKQRVERAQRRPVPATAERDVNVVPDPRAERDVPAPPEIADVARKIRPIEILGQPNAHHTSEPDRHVAVAAEVE